MFRKIFAKKRREEVNPDLLTELIKHDSEYPTSRKNYFKKFKKKYFPPTLRYIILGELKYIPDWFLFGKKRYVLPFAAMLVFFALTVPTTAGLEYGLPQHSSLKPSNLIVHNKNDNLAAQPLQEQKEASEKVIIEEEKNTEEMVFSEQQEKIGNDKKENIPQESNPAQEEPKKNLNNMEQQPNLEKVAEKIDFCDLVVESYAMEDRINEKIEVLSTRKFLNEESNYPLEFFEAAHIGDQKIIECYNNPEKISLDKIFLNNRQISMKKHNFSSEVNIPDTILENFYTTEPTEREYRLYLVEHNHKVLIFNFNPADLPQNIRIRN